MIVTRTPYRISFFGGGTDYKSWFSRHGGAVLAASIDKYCWISIRPPTQFGPKFKVVYSRVDQCDRLEQIQHPAVRECLRYLRVDGAEIHHWGDLPARSGVGSSSAFVVGLLNGLHASRHRNIDRYNLAREAIHLEQDVLGETVGSQDQAVCSYGGLKAYRFDALYPNPAVIQNFGGMPVCRELEKRLMLFYTGVQRTSSDVAATYVGDFDKNKEIMQAIRSSVDTGVECLRTGDLDKFGHLLDSTWIIKRALGNGISTPQIDTMYSQAKRHGALGGKLLGAGGGGFFLFYVPLDEQPAVKRAMKDYVQVAFKFEYDGSRVIFYER